MVVGSAHRLLLLVVALWCLSLATGELKSSVHSRRDPRATNQDDVIVAEDRAVASTSSAPQAPKKGTVVQDGDGKTKGTKALNGKPKKVTVVQDVDDSVESPPPDYVSSLLASKRSKQDDLSDPSPVYATLMGTRQNQDNSVQDNSAEDNSVQDNSVQDNSADSSSGGDVERRGDKPTWQRVLKRVLWGGESVGDNVSPSPLPTFAQLAERKCPKLDLSQAKPPVPDTYGGLYPRSDCVYPQDADIPQRFGEAMKVSLGGWPKDSLESIYRNSRRQFFMPGRDEFYDKPRKVFKNQWAWDVIQNGRTQNVQQTKRRISRFQHKHQFFSSKQKVAEFFDIDNNKAEKCADAFIRYVRASEEFEHDNDGSANGRRVLRRVFPPAHVFFHPGIRKKIDRSKLFAIAKRFPKGAVLHSHFWSLSSAEFVARMMVDPAMTQDNWRVIDQSHSAEDIVYNAAYEFAFNQVEDEIKKTLDLDEGQFIRKSVYLCGTIDDLLSMSVLQMFDTNLARSRETSQGDRRDCQFYERKPGEKPAADGDRVPVGTMSFFPTHPNPVDNEDCKLWDEGQCRNLELELFGLNEGSSLQDVKDKVEGELARMGGWVNLVDQLENPVIRMRLVEQRDKALEELKKAHMFCQDDANPFESAYNAPETPLDLEGLSWFLSGPPERLVLLSYFQMGYWDWHSLVQSRELWEKLEATWARTGNVAKFLPFFHMYVLDTQRRLLKDNVQVLEARHKPGALYNYGQDDNHWELQEKLLPEQELELIDQLISNMNRAVRNFPEWQAEDRVGLNQVKIKVIAFERRIGETMGNKQATKLAGTLENYGLLTKGIALPCEDPKRLYGTGGKDGRSKCGMLAGIDYAGEEDAFYYYGIGSNRDIARHYFHNIMKADEKMETAIGKRFSDVYLNPHHSGESNNAESFSLYDSYITQAANGYGEPDTQEKQGRPMRFGHGIMLDKFPFLEELLLGDAENPPNVLIEANPISNQVLGYVPDLRNHPALGQMRRGLAVSLSFDDPSQFGYSDVSYDWYQAIAAWKIDLSDMKELALNSIAFSSLSIAEQAEVFKLWEIRYEKFLEQIIDEAQGLLFDHRDDLEQKSKYYYQSPADGHMDPLLIWVHTQCDGVSDWSPSLQGNKWKQHKFKNSLQKMLNGIMSKKKGDSDGIMVDSV